MARKWFSYLLVALIAVQSVVAVADAHRSHQTSNKHLEFNHQHDADFLETESGVSVPDLLIDEPSSSADGQHDCHHCCHCHGMGHFCPPASNSLSSAQLDLGSTAYHFGYHSTLSSPSFRPPIA